MENYTLVEHLNSINLEYYSETCSNDHLCKMTNAESTKANSRQIITLKTRPATTFLIPKWKKTCLKQLQNFIQQRNAKKHKEQFIKNKRLSDYIYSIANL